MTGMKGAKDFQSGDNPWRVPCWDQSWSKEDDWRGITDPQERKKKQNRINQRIYRERRNAKKAAIPCEQEACATTLELIDGGTLLTDPQRIAQIREATRMAYEAYTLRDARPTNLHVLIRLNVLHALSRNAALMGFWPEGLCKDDYVSPYNDHGPRLPHKPLPSIGCPPSLAPTRAQQTIVHHPWIDLFPFPSFRERVLYAVDTGDLDEDELCLDILQVDGRDLAQRPALIVWGDSSNPSAWETSVAFLRKWGHLVQGCPELLQSTNYWRSKRGEPMLAR